MKPRSGKKPVGVKIINIGGHRCPELPVPKGSSSLGRIGSVATRNRIINNGTHLFYHDKPGAYMDQRNIDFYDVLARGGVGLIVVASGPLPPRSARRVPHRQGRLYPRFCRVGPDDPQARISRVRPVIPPSDRCSRLFCRVSLPRPHPFLRTSLPGPNLQRHES